MTLATGLWFGYQKLDQYQEQEKDQAEIAKIVVDEGFRRCVYRDSLGFKTIGFGHLVKKGESFKCITPEDAVELLRADYAYAKESVKKNYPWASGEAQRVLVNLTFQLGENRLAKFKKTLTYMEQGDYYKAAGELLDSKLHRQTPKRLERHAGRLLALAEDIEGESIWHNQL